MTNRFDQDRRIRNACTVKLVNDYVDINVSADELEKKLFDCGFEVEEKWQVGKDISGIVVGYVESCEPIPETHLHVCQVNVGGPELLSDLLWC